MNGLDMRYPFVDNIKPFSTCTRVARRGRADKSRVHLALLANPIRRIASLLVFVIDFHIVGRRNSSQIGHRHLFAVSRDDPPEGADLSTRV